MRIEHQGSIRHGVSHPLCFMSHVAIMEEDRSALKILTDILIGKRPLGRPRRRWEDNI